MAWLWESAHVAPPCRKLEHRTVASWNIEVLQTYMFEPDTDCQEVEEELLEHRCLEVDASEWYVLFLKG